VPIEELGIDVGDLGSLDDLSGVDGTGVMRQVVEDTVEVRAVAAGFRPAARRGEDEDLLVRPAS
jgi:hypothetical protein